MGWWMFGVGEILWPERFKSHQTYSLIEQVFRWKTFSRFGIKRTMVKISQTQVLFSGNRLFISSSFFWFQWENLRQSWQMREYNLFQFNVICFFTSSKLCLDNNYVNMLTCVLSLLLMLQQTCEYLNNTVSLINPFINPSSSSWNHVYKCDVPCSIQYAEFRI